MFNLRLGYAWLPDAKPAADPHLLIRLLDAIADSGSLQRAAEATGVSYRHAWGLMESAHSTLGKPLVTKARGRGTQLTPFARKLQAADRCVQARLADLLARATAQADQELAAFFAAPDHALRVVASHDLALTRLHEYVLATGSLRFDLEFRSSRESLRALARGEAEIAGFHLRSEDRTSTLLSEFSGRGHAPKPMLFEFALRDQGLLVARGNPKRIRALADLGRPGIRFVNRQPGSGSRLEFDALLEEAGVDPAHIHGYSHEEFTHLAVAATVAAAQADAGYGIRAAAAQYGIDFVPLVTERYLLAVQPETARGPAFLALLEMIRTAKVRRWLGRLAGYHFAHSGEPAELR